MKHAYTKHVLPSSHPPKAAWLHWAGLLALIVVLLSALVPWQASYGDGTPTPTPVPITAANADQVTELMRIGRGRLSRISFSPNGEMMALLGPVGVWVYDANDLNAEPRLMGKYMCGIEAVAWSPDSTRIVIAGGYENCSEPDVRVWDAQSGQLLHGLEREPRLGSAYKVTWSPDGKYIAAMDLYTVALWDATTGRSVQLFEGHWNWLKDIAWKPDGSRFITTDSGVTFLWDADSVQIIAELSGGLAAEWSPDGALLALSDVEDTVHVWDIEHRQEIGSVEGADLGERVGMFWSPDGTFLAVAQPPSHVTKAGGSVRIWSAQDQQVHYTFEDDFYATWSPDGARFATAGKDHAVRIWNTQDGQLLYTLEDERSAVQKIIWSPNSPVLVAAYADGTVRLWDAQRGRLLHVLKSDQGEPWLTVLSPDGRHLVVADAMGTVRVWNVRDGRLLTTIKEYTTSYVNDVDWSPDGTRLVSATGCVYCEDNAVHIWDAQTGRELTTFEGNSCAVQSVAWSPSGKQIASAGGDWDCTDYAVYLWDVESPQEPVRLTGHTYTVWSVAWSPDGKRIASTGYDRSARIWDAQTGRELVTLDGDMNVAWSPDGKYIATPYITSVNLQREKYPIRIWDVQTRQVVDTLEGRWYYPANVTWSPDGTRIAFGGADQSVYIWDVQSGQLLHTLPFPTLGINEGRPEMVRDIAWSPDGRLLATASEDNRVRIWDAQDGRELAVLIGHARWTSAVAWSPDGTRLASASEDGTIRIWGIASP